jgi:hypothetical protein
MTRFADTYFYLAMLNARDGEARRCTDILHRLWHSYCEALRGPFYNENDIHLR